MGVIVFAAINTWVLPAGEYHKLSAGDGHAFILKTNTGTVNLPYNQATLDSLGVLIPFAKFAEGDIRRPISVPGTFQKKPSNPQGFLSILQAPLKGVYESIDIILFVLVIGGFMFVFNQTGAMQKGINWITYRMKGRESWLIVIMTSITSFLAASYGMAEEGLVFYPIIVPIFLVAGYDLMVPLAVVFGGLSVGCIPAFSNPFSTIIASNAAGVDWMDGITQRLVLWVIVTGILILYILRYARKVKKDPTASLVYKTDGIVKPSFDITVQEQTESPVLEAKTKLVLALYVATFLTMIIGVVFFKWWTLEMSALFLASSILIGVLTGMGEKIFLSEFVKGCESLLSVSLIVGVARGVTIILNDGQISDSVLYYAVKLVGGMPPALFILMLLVFFLLFSLFIQSSSGMAVLTMPIIGALAVIINIPGREIVNAYLSGMAITALVAPTGLLLPTLALVNVSFKAWVKFIVPLMIILVLISALFLVAGLYLFG